MAYRGTPTQPSASPRRRSSMTTLTRLLAAALVASSSALAAQQPAARPLSRANLDTTCAACTDFYQFANGGWLKKNVIAPDKAHLGSFGMLGDKNQEVVQKIVIDDAHLVSDGEA